MRGHKGQMIQKLETVLIISAVHMGARGFFREPIALSLTCFIVNCLCQRSGLACLGL